ncbi:hypothetical protein HK102_006283, partial [Quaeritorhiza haematococci]
DLAKVLKYHILKPGTIVYSEDVLRKKKEELPLLVGTVEGADVEVGWEVVEAHGRNWTVVTLNKDSYVHAPDGIASNGAVHSITKVLTPPDMNLNAAAAAASASASHSSVHYAPFRASLVDLVGSYGGEGGGFGKDEDGWVREILRGY